MSDDTRDDEQRLELATVHRLPIPADGDVLEGEIVSDEEYERLTSQKAQALERYSGYRQDVTVVIERARRVAGHERTRAAFRHTIYYPLAGLRVVTGRWRDAYGTGRYERMMRAAEAAGDHDKLLEWESRDVGEKERRHKRAMAWLDTPGKLFKAAAYAVAAVVGVLLLLGVILAISTGQVSDVTGPIVAVFDAVAFVVWFLVTYGAVLTILATLAGFGYLYIQGRNHGDTPDWLMTPAATASTKDPVPDEGTIINAIKHLGIRGFNRALKDGWRVRFITQPTISGKGWWAQLELPPACPVSEVVRRKDMLAHNLVRFPKEVWPTEPNDQPGVLDLWVANQGALSGPVEQWPVLADLDTGHVDYFSGVPAAVTLRGDVVKGRLYEANFFFGGSPGGGKSTMAITLCLGAMLDPLVEIDVVVMAQNADYEPMRPRLRSLTTGVGDGTVEKCMALLNELFADLETRGEALKEHDERFIYRDLAKKDARLRPRVVVIDECQHLFLSTFGPAAIKIALKLITTSRKYAITLIFLTPEPTNDSCPRQIMTVISNKACFPIGDQTGNDAILGTGSYKTGISAVGLEPKTLQADGTVLLGDIGTCMARGFTPKPQLLRSFYVPQDDAHRVTKRALELRADAGPAPAAAEAPPVDHLADILHVLGGEARMTTERVLSALTAFNPRVYQSWSHGDLYTRLAPWEAEPYKTGGLMKVNAARVREAIARRDSGEEPEPNES